MTDPRWLDPEAAARHISCRVDELPRLLRRGLLPRPSYHLGPRSPRYDREALDALFTKNAAAPSVDAAVQEAVNAIIQGKSRPQAPGRRVG